MHFAGLEAMAKLSHFVQSCCAAAVSDSGRVSAKWHPFQDFVVLVEQECSMIGPLLEEQHQMVSPTDSLVVVLVRVSEVGLAEVLKGTVRILDNHQLVGSGIAVVGMECSVVECLAAAFV